MRPNTPHAVFSPEDVICHGGHFYATSTMQDTMFGIVHTFISPASLTNAEKSTHGVLLRRIAGFYHDVLVLKQLEEDGKSFSFSLILTLIKLTVLTFFIPEYDQGHVPKLTNFNSVINLFTFCNVMILMNVLDLRTYQRPQGDYLWYTYDVNSIPAKERYEMSYARGRCWDILLWFFHVYQIFDKDTGESINGFEEVAVSYLSHQCSAIIHCKKGALKNRLDSGEYFTLQNLERQMKSCFRGYEHILSITLTPPAPDRELSLAFPDADRYEVRKLVRACPYKRK